MYLDYGLEFEEYKINLFLSKINEALGGKKTIRKKGPESDKPDKEQFYKLYGDKIKRPDGEKGGESR